MKLRSAVILCCLAFAFAFALAATAQTVNVTGTWDGQYTLTDHCDNGATFTSQGAATAQFLQSGQAVSGGIVLNNLTGTDGSTCTPKPPKTFAIPLTGSISGGTFAGTLFSPDGAAIRFSASVTAASITLSFTAQPTTSGSITLSLTSSQPPDSSLSGTYMGTYTATIVPCLKLAPVTYGGPLSLALTQIGSAIIGSASFSGMKSDHQDMSGTCTLVDDPATTIPLQAQLSGNMITGEFSKPTKGKVHPFTATVSGNTITVNVPGEFPGEGLTAVLTRSGSGGPPPPTILSFTATPSTIMAGAAATLSWSTVSSSGVIIDNGIGAQAVSGNISVAPQLTTTYMLTASGIGGSATATATVTVTGSGPRVVAGTFPSGMLEASGEQGATDSFSLANVGGDPANVSATANGSFFSISPTAFPIAGRSNQSIVIVANAQNPGTYDGTITISGDSITQPIIVPVHLLVAAAPTGSVNPQPATARVDVSAPANQNPTGSVSFTNTGSSPVTGIAVADVPWIVPQVGAITINPGQTLGVSFNIDRSKRADTNALFGGASGSISLRFLGASVSSHRYASGTTPTSTVSVTIVDVVKPDVTPGAPPPLGSGELALLIAGHGSAAGVAGDLLLSNRGNAPVPDLKLFLTAASQIATLPQLTANLGVTVPSVSTSVFGVETGGSMMLRGSLDNVTAAALRMVNPAGAAAYFSATPIFRSDRGIAPGGKIVLSGVEKSDNAKTVVFVQELSGNSATADLQAYDASGNATGAKNTVSMGAFVSSVDQNTVVTGAQSIVITNTSQGSSRINAYARVVDNSTGDVWIVVDPTATVGASNTFIMPTIASPAVTAQTDIYVTNGSQAQTTASLAVVTASTRRRAVRSGSTPGSPLTLTIRPHETQRSTIAPATGYVRISGSSNTISAAGRVTMRSNGRFGSSLPVLPLDAAMGLGSAKRFSGVGDSSARTIAAGTPATFRSTLMLIETTGQSATVRVSVWYTLSAGIAVSAQTVAFKEFTVDASQMLLITDLARSVIGSQRDAFGDLRDMQVDVEVIGGSGRVLPYIESIDNGTGDPVIRSE